jgi:hypothetical protein
MKDQTQTSIKRSLALIIGDTIVFLTFAFIGVTSHREAVSPLRIVMIAAPFALGWFIVAPLLGAFTHKKTATVHNMALTTLLAWLPAFILGITFRGLTGDHKVPPPSFIIITLISNTILLMLWRLPFAWLTCKRNK